MQKIVHITVPQNITPAQSKVIQRASELHPSWNVMVWRDPIKKDGFLLEKYWSKVNSGAGFADLLRLDILYRFGGVYIDSDVNLLKPLDELVSKFEFFIASEDGDYLTNAVVGARKNSPVIRCLIDELLRNEPNWMLPPNITTGPMFYTQNLRWHREIAVLPRQAFYPYSGEISEEKRHHRHSYSEHLWAHSWKAAGEGPAPRKSSMLGFFKKRTRAAIKGGFSAWHRVKALDPIPPGPQFYPCSDELVARTIHGFRIVVDGRDISLTPHLVFNGFYEPEEEAFVKSVVKGGDWVVDVGSNVGSFSLLAAQQIGPFGRVFAYEPNPRPAKLMAKSLVMNWVHDRVVQRPVAVGATNETVSLTFGSDNLGDAQVGQGDVAGSTAGESLRVLGPEQANFIKIESVRLDDEFSIDLPIKLLKIDVEGYEGRVLEGAGRLLRNRCIDFVMLELLQEVAGSRWHETLSAVRKILDCGYTLCTLTNSGSVIEQNDLVEVIQSGARNIVLAARDQYSKA